MSDREGEERARSAHDVLGLRARRLHAGGLGSLRERGEVVLRGKS
ncbi:MAG: hypothetical protein RL546_784 [Chloroflexota bacterium]